MKIFITILGIAVLSLASLTYGHGTGQTLGVQVGDYMVDVDYDSLVAEIDADESIRFNFSLWNKERTEPVEFTGVWVNIKLQGGFKSVFSGQLGIPEFGGPGMSTIFPDAGSYELTARFMNKDGTLAEAIFPLTVIAVEGGGVTRNLFIAMLVGVILGVAISFFFIRKRSI